MYFTLIVCFSPPRSASLKQPVPPPQPPEAGRRAAPGQQTTRGFSPAENRGRGGPAPSRDPRATLSECARERRPGRMRAAPRARGAHARAAQMMKVRAGTCCGGSLPGPAGRRLGVGRGQALSRGRRRSPSPPPAERLSRGRGRGRAHARAHFRTRARFGATTCRSPGECRHEREREARRRDARARRSPPVAFSACARPTPRADSLATAPGLNGMPQRSRARNRQRRPAPRLRRERIPGRNRLRRALPGSSCWASVSIHWSDFGLVKV